MDPLPKGSVGGVTVGGTVLRQPYGHPDGAMLFVVEGLKPDVGSQLVAEALADWETRLPQFVRAGSSQTTADWPATVSTHTFITHDGTVGAAVFGSAVYRTDPDFSGPLPWSVLRTAVIAVGRHLDGRGVAGARITRPRRARKFTSALPDPVASYAGVARTPSFRREFSNLQGQVADALLQWMGAGSMPLGFGTGQLNVVVSRADAAALTRAAMGAGAPFAELVSLDPGGPRSARFYHGSIALLTHGRWRDCFRGRP